MIPLHKLVVTQDGLRNPGQLGPMIEFVRRGGFFTKDALLAFHVFNSLSNYPSIMHVAKIDDTFYLHDGHHRAIAAWVAGRHAIHSDEYEVIPYTFDDYMKSNPKKKWFTPFDPRTEVRLADLTEYRNIIAESKLSHHSLVALHGDKYKTARRFSTLEEMNERM
jgi:hypothetical protein